MLRGEDLPSVNALLNLTSAVLLAAGYAAIRRRRVRLHAACMLTALGVSMLFFRIPFSGYHVLIIGVLALVGFIEGYDLVMTGSLLVLAKTPLHLTDTEIRARYRARSWSARPDPASAAEVTAPLRATATM